MKIPFFALVILLIAQLNACQYAVDTSSLPDAKKFIVIDAELSDSFGKVNVTYTLKDVTPQGAYLFPPPPDATAYVLDSHGNRTDFIPNGTKNMAFKGLPGETYKLYVTADGEEYESKAETMNACPPLDSVTPIYKRETFRSPDDLYYDGFDVYAQTPDIPGQENYYQWEWIHYEHALACNVIDGFLIPCVPYECWTIKYNTKVVVQSDKLRDGQVIAHKVARIPFATPPNNYYLRVEQRSITPSVFAYLQSLETQTQNTGTLFDIPAQTKFSPNIRNVNNPAEQIIGVFSVYSARHKVIYIDMRQTIPGATAKVILELRPFSPDPFAGSPCTETVYRTQVKPEGWIE